MKGTGSPVTAYAFSGQGCRGFSLIELVMVLILVSVIAGMLALPMSSLMESQRQLGAASVQKTDVDYTLRRISSAIRAASTVTSCTADTLALTVNGANVSFSRVGQSILLDGAEPVLTGVSSDSVMCDDTYAAALDVYRVSVSVVDDATYTVSLFRRVP